MKLSTIRSLLLNDPNAALKLIIYDSFSETHPTNLIAETVVPLHKKGSLAIYHLISS